MNIIPLPRAVLCMDCDCVSDATGEQCPACGRGPLMNLGNTIGTMPAQPKEESNAYDPEPCAA